MHVLNVPLEEVFFYDAGNEWHSWEREEALRILIDLFMQTFINRLIDAYGKWPGCNKDMKIELIYLVPGYK